MAWLFVLGVALELAGALLIAAALLLPVLRRDWAALARYAERAAHDTPVLEDMLEPAYVLSGATLLVTGFSLQLVGYVVQFARDVLIVTAAVTAVGGWLIGWRVARLVFAPALLRRALAHNPMKAPPDAGSS